MAKRALCISVLIFISGLCINISRAAGNEPNKNTDNEKIDAQQKYAGYYAELDAIAAGTCPVKTIKDVRKPQQSAAKEPAYLTEVIGQIDADPNSHGKTEMSVVGEWINRDGINQAGTTLQEYQVGEISLEKKAWHKDIYVEATTSAQDGRDITIQTFDPNSGFIIAEPLTDEAPLSGYVPKLHLTLNLPIEKDWSVITIYMKARGGQAYSRIQLTTQRNDKDHSTLLYIFVKTNPEGSRNLLYDWGYQWNQTRWRKQINTVCEKEKAAAVSAGKEFDEKVFLAKMHAKEVATINQWQTEVDRYIEEIESAMTYEKWLKREHEPPLMAMKTPAQLREAYQAEVERRIDEIKYRATKMQTIIEKTNVPIRFYGRVIDQDDRAISDVNISADVSYPVISGGAQKTERAVTDQNGFFEIQSRGWELIIEPIVKQGYEYVRQENKQTSFAYANRIHVFEPNRNAPVIFTLRKRGKPAYLYTNMYESARTYMRFDLKTDISKEIGLIGAWVNRDGTWQNETTWDDYIKGLTRDVRENEWHKDLRKDLHIECQTDSNGAKIVFREMDPNSGIILGDKLLGEAPESGYAKIVSLKLQDPNHAGQGGNIYKYLYVKGRGGALYSRIEIWCQIVRNEITINNRIYTNPEGERNLEYDDVFQHYEQRWRDKIGNIIKKAEYSASRNGQSFNKQELLKELDADKKTTIQKWIDEGAKAKKQLEERARQDSQSNKKAA